MANPKMHLGERKKPAKLEWKGMGPWGSRVIVVLELVMLHVDALDEEEISDGGGDEDEDHPQRAHLPPLGHCISPK
jgi:hypothetical protein